jgi:hypothetical protein
MATKYDTDFFISEQPVAPTATAPAVVAAPTAAPAAAPAAEPENKWSNVFVEEGDTLPEEKKGALTPEWLAAILGGAGGLAFGKIPEIRSDSVAARLAEQIHGAPSGSLTTAQDIAAPQGAGPIARRVADLYTPAVPAAAELPPPPAAAVLTPGEKWGAKTGYGSGAGTVQEASSAYQRRLGKGKITSRLDKLYGPATAGESSQLAQRLLERSASAEAAQAAQVQAAAQRLVAEAAQAEANRVAEAARQSTLARMARNIEKAGGTSALLQKGMRTGLNVGAGVLGGLHGFQGASDIQQQGANVGNVAQTAEGAGLLYAMRNPSVGLPVAGGAAMTQAGKSMYDTGLTPENTAKMIGGAGLTVMPRSPMIGGIMQIPQMQVAIMEWLKANPEKAAQLNKPITPPFSTAPIRRPQ